MVSHQVSKAIDTEDPVSHHWVTRADYVPSPTPHDGNMQLLSMLNAGLRESADDNTHEEVMPLAKSKCICSSSLPETIVHTVRRYYTVLTAVSTAFIDQEAVGLLPAHSQ